MWIYMKNFVIAFCSESSVHGVKYLIKDKNIVSRCYWCIMLIFALYCCGQFSILLSHRFLEIPIRMIVKNNQALTEKLPLPSITFCSENPTDEWYERGLDEMKLPPGYTRDEVLVAMRLGVGALTLRFVHNQEELNATLMNMLDHVLKYNNITTRRFVEQVSVPCDVLLGRCQLRGRVLPCAEIFQRVNGQCCRFYDNPDTFISSGNVFGNNLIVVTTMDHGEAHISVHSPNSEPQMGQEMHTMSNGYYVMFYVNPVVVLKSEEVHEMQEKVGACVHQDEHELRFFESYDYFNCVVELMINKSIVLCGCAAANMPAPDQYTCNFTQMNCLRSQQGLNKMPTGLLTVQTHDNLEKLAIEKGILLQNCPETCSFTYYKRSFKPRVLVPEYDSTGFVTGVDPESQYVMHFTYLTQFYRIDEFVLVTDWISLLSNLGGVYGLFLGCSMLTLAELAYYLWSSIISKLWNANRAVADVSVNR